ncbi:hypothetical protein EAG_03393 [Camponotus floridanus]|uniref:Uncharacterized protein n=1 Tax=Camponotus floridanus TaxID=104421 RepID=E2AYL0_CAMFO|nr:hypothetical protein EAG_03393 [Camponotus floridanus]
MRSRMLYVYWALLLISMVSSGLLFLIVASETQTEDSSSYSEKNETYESYSNITLNYDNHENFESSIMDIKTQATMTLKTNQNDQYRQEEAITVSASIKKVTNDNAQVGKDVLTESLTQQPNLSQEGVAKEEQSLLL